MTHLSSRRPESHLLNVAVFSRYFVPGSKAGGPIRSLSALTSTREADFSVITSDRDIGDEMPFLGLDYSNWSDQSTRRVWYLKRGSIMAAARCIHSLRNAPPDVYYFNSLFDRVFSLAPLALIALRVLPRRNVLLAPRGELLAGAMSHKSSRKRLSLIMIRVLLRAIRATLHSTTDTEHQTAKGLFPELKHILHPDLFSIEKTRESVRSWNSERELRVTFLSRIHPHKGLDRAVQTLNGTTRPVLFRVIGDAEDHDYFEECKRAIALLPNNVTVDIAGPQPYDTVLSVFSESDILLLPTKSENFGHAIREALSTGCLVLTSDATPWTELLESLNLPTPEWHDSAGFEAAFQRIASSSCESLRRHQAVVVQNYRQWELTQSHARTGMIEVLSKVACDRKAKEEPASRKTKYE